MSIGVGLAFFNSITRAPPSAASTCSDPYRDDLRPGVARGLGTYAATGLEDGAEPWRGHFDTSQPTLTERAVDELSPWP